MYRPDDRLFGEIADTQESYSGEVAEAFMTPGIAGEMHSVGQELALLGLSDDPELLGSVLSNVVKNIRKGVKSIKKSGIKGTFSLSQKRKNTPSAPSPDGGFSPAGLLSNPAVLIGGVAVVGLVAFLLLKRKGR